MFVVAVALFTIASATLLVAQRPPDPSRGRARRAFPLVVATVAGCCLGAQVAATAMQARTESTLIVASGLLLALAARRRSAASRRQLDDLGNHLLLVRQRRAHRRDQDR